MDTYARPSDELTCRELAEMVTDYLEQALTERERTRFELHVQKCVDCNEYLDQIRRTITTLGRLGRGALDDAERTRLLALFRRAGGSSDG